MGIRKESLKKPQRTNHEFFITESGPPGKNKIMSALRSLLENKEFSTITTSEIAGKAGVTEALIYKYFPDKRGLLNQVLAEYMKGFISNMNQQLQGATGALNKLATVIEAHLRMYADNRVFGRILIIEVRNHNDYFNSEAYSIVREYAGAIRAIVKEGQENGEISADVDSDVIVRIILGAIEHASLPWVLFSARMDPVAIASQLHRILVRGLVV